MAIYNSREVTLLAPAEKVFNKYTNFEALADTLQNIPEDQIPADKRDLLDKVQVSADTISISGAPAPMGSLSFRLTEMVEPSLVVLNCENSPVPLSLKLHIIPVDADSSRAYVEIDINLPPMLAPMVKAPLEQLTETIANALVQIPIE